MTGATGIPLKERSTRSYRCGGVLQAVAPLGARGEWVERDGGERCLRMPSRRVMSIRSSVEPVSVALASVRVGIDSAQHSGGRAR